MNVLFLSGEYPSPVDPHRAVFNRQMVRGLAARHTLRVVCPIAWTERVRAQSPTAPAGTGDPFRVLYPTFYFPPRIALHLRGNWMWWSLRRMLRREAREHRPDVILSYWAHPDGEAALRFGRHLGIPVVLMVGGSDVLLITSDPKRRQRVDAVLRGVDGVITIGENLRQQVIARGVPDTRVTSVMRPVGSRFEPGDRAAARARCGVTSTSPVLVWVGRLVPVKGLDTLLRAQALMRERGLTPLVCLAGDGPERETLETLATELGLGSNIRWLGAVPHDALPDWFRAADVTVLPSLSEGVPNVLLESIACGTPFVASRVGSIPEIADDACDRLVPPGQPEALAAAIIDILTPRAVVPTRVKGVATEREFQSRLDTVLGAAVAQRQGQSQTGRQTALRSATLTKPNRWRQVARRALVGAVPRQCLVAAGAPSSRAVCLTFDDGPHDVVTPQLLDILKREGARATFFVRGDRASEHPAIVRRIVDEGHLLGHHSWSHSVPQQTSASRLLEEVRQTREWLRHEMGRDSHWFRPPHGKVSAAKVLGLWRAGQTIALWSVDPGDVFRAHAREMLDWFVAHPPQGGDVVLLHDTCAVTLEAMPELIRMIRSAGLELATLDRFGGWSAAS